MINAEHEDEEAWDDPEAPDDADLGPDDDSAETVPCPYCGADVYEQAEVCSRCGAYISTEDAPARKPTWMVIASLAVLAAMGLYWVLRRA